MDEEITDELPEDLDVHGFVGTYDFPDNSRRRVPGFLYLFISATLFLISVFFESSPFTNWGYIAAGVVLLLMALYHLQASWRLSIDETGALLEATKSAGFPVGHASAQMVWRGLRSRPTWRILLYSNDSPPSNRGLFLVDAIDGSVLESNVEANPENWEK
mgnify:FL=1